MLVIENVNVVDVDVGVLVVVRSVVSQVSELRKV